MHVNQAHVKMVEDVSFKTVVTHGDVNAKMDLLDQDVKIVNYFFSNVVNEETNKYFNKNN
mgnify:CR=1 FL=1